MNAHSESIALMHKYLDGDLNKAEEQQLKGHLEGCEDCQAHLRDLKRTIALLQSSEHIEAPPSFAEKVMNNLPKEKKRMKYKRWVKSHPIIVAAAVFFIFMLGGMFTDWNQDSQLVVSKQENLIIQGDTVIVPEGVVVEGDLLVKNGNLVIEGVIDGDVTIVNGELVESKSLDGEGLMASVGEINGELKTVNRMFEWLWYQIKGFFSGVFSTD
ncbi:anti-sigma factor [Oceanobacillus zhaokaii]|uniref:Anti-sigma-W factor RsiW n=1 Tax=Oceanobacillus zhaokaii TaxID=2052660 RepID=A0A345PCF7_9BACI|nr:zf-HC2 domain-containing protein [Oceanobacillus zhaokaii]AXI07687.1 anti-sigma factor [Oceanobacillus zhaokaii]